MNVPDGPLDLANDGVHELGYYLDQLNEVTLEGFVKVEPRGDDFDVERLQRIVQSVWKKLSATDRAVIVGFIGGVVKKEKLSRDDYSQSFRTPRVEVHPLCGDWPTDVHWPLVAWSCRDGYIAIHKTWMDRLSDGAMEVVIAMQLLDLKLDVALGHDQSVGPVTRARTRAAMLKDRGWNILVFQDEFKAHRAAVWTDWTEALAKEAMSPRGAA
jgi:hypothetical protein